MVAISTLSWEEVSAPDFGARAAWRQAVADMTLGKHLWNFPDGICITLIYGH